MKIRKEMEEDVGNEEGKKETVGSVRATALRYEIQLSRR